MDTVRRLSPHPDTLYEWALAVERAGRTDEAAKMFARFEADAVGETEGPDHANPQLVDLYLKTDRLDEALALADRIGANAQESIAAFRELARAVEREPHHAARALERRLFAERWQDDPFWRQVAAWRDRRA